jgi:hypothetical protein
MGLVMADIKLDYVNSFYDSRGKLVISFGGRATRGSRSRAGGGRRSSWLTTMS